MVENQNPFLSVIIPCYNASSTIVETLKCFDSQFNNFSDFEIIVIDDGSTDASIAIVNDYITQHNRVRLYKKINGGVSSARNYGLEKAKGRYVWFFDADDLLFDNALSQIINHLKQYSPDILRFNSVTIDSKIKDNVDALNNSKQCKITYLGKYQDYLYDGVISFACWSLVVKKVLLVENDVKFNESLSIHEDVTWGLTLAEKVPDATFLHINLRAVKYMLRRNSIVNTVNYEANKKHLISTILFSKILNNSKLHRGGVFGAIIA